MHHVPARLLQQRILQPPPGRAVLQHPQLDGLVVAPRRSRCTSRASSNRSFRRFNAPASSGRLNTANIRNRSPTGCLAQPVMRLLVDDHISPDAPPTSGPSTRASSHGRYPNTAASAGSSNRTGRRCRANAAATGPNTCPAIQSPTCARSRPHAPTDDPGPRSTADTGPSPGTPQTATPSCPAPPDDRPETPRPHRSAATATATARRIQHLQPQLRMRRAALPAAASALAPHRIAHRDSLPEQPEAFRQNRPLQRRLSGGRTSRRRQPSGRRRPQRSDLIFSTSVEIALAATNQVQTQIQASHPTCVPKLT